MAIHPVILCGGAGTRLWPASREATPKQFIPLIGPRSSFQETVLRILETEAAARPIIVAGRRHADQIASQLAAIGVAADVLLEPEARDSAPAMAAAAAWIAAADPGGIAVLIAADHHVPDAPAFREAVGRAARAAQGGWIVTLGVAADGPSTAYGYIRPGEAIAAAPGVQLVQAFVEKPDAATAASYVDAGYLWNSGNFIVQARLLLDELEQFAPEIAAAARDAVATAAELAPGVWLLGEGFVAAPRISIDYAVMERTERAAVAPVSFAWSDLGAWDAIWTASGRDAAGNSAVGDVLLTESEGCLARIAPGMSAAIIGARRLAVVVERDAVLVCDLELSQAVKAAATTLAAPRPPLLASQPLQAVVAGYRTWLWYNALPLWWAVGADHAGGGFHEQLDPGGSPTVAPRRARVAARQTYVFASAGRMGWPGPWRAAAQHGWTALDTAYRRDDGLFRTLVAADGRALDETAWLYDQAFMALAMASLHAAAPGRPEFRNRADALLDGIRGQMAHDNGFREAGEQPFKSNPHMHLLEAALAWTEAGGGAPWRALADEIADLALERMIDPEGGFIREVFDAQWRPAAGPLGALVEPGHQFEWAWLLDRWSELADDPRAAAAARRLAAAGIRGVDRDRHAAIDAMDDHLAPTKTSARLWPQTERLKASARFALRSDGQERQHWLEEAKSAAAGLWRYLDVEPRGLWRDNQDAKGRFRPEPAPASSFYHIIEAVRALISVEAL